MQNDFDYGIFEKTDHRPWPMPASPWVMTQTWHDLLFAHWPVDVASLGAKIPAGLELDLFEGQAWLGVVPFRMTNVAPRAVPALPWVSAFPEVNVRTYVRAGGRAGVYFFSLDAASPVAVWIARTLLHLPYYSASMQCETRDGWIHYSSRRTSARGRSRGARRAIPSDRGRARAGQRNARAFSDGAILPLYRGPRLAAAPARHPSSAVAAAARRGGADGEHDG